MARTTGPLMSLDASGSIAGTIVFSKWKGRNYVRQLVTPANPQSALQVSTRAMMKFLSQRWKPDLTDAQEATWDDDAAARAVSPFNSYIKENLERWTQFTSPTKVTPVLAVGVVPTFTTLPTSVGAVGQIVINWDLNALNDGWGLLIFAGLVNPIVTGRNNMEHVAQLSLLTADTATLTNMDPGSYFVNYRSFTDDGVLSAQLGQTTATVT